MLLTYPVCFYPEEVGFSVIVPDFDNAATQGDTLADAIYMAEDLIAGLIVSNIEENEPNPIPKASDVSSNLLDAEYGNGFVSVVVVDLDKKQNEFAQQNKLVKKTLTIPNWINERATKSGINFSQTLTEALLEKI